MPKLKVFRTTIGFYDAVVAAPSMKAAVEAWGARPNIFRHGLAREIHDVKLVKMASEKPRVVFRKLVGSGKEFAPMTGRFKPL
jgi:colicin import membrane protein